MADAIARFTWPRRRRTLGDMTANDRCDPATGVEETPMQLSANVGRKQMNVAELARVARPEELVLLDTPEHVELAGAFVDRRADRQPHQHQADAVLLILLVEAVLIEGERAAVQEAVHHGHRRAVHAKDEHPEPAAVERALGDFVMKGAQ